MVLLDRDFPTELAVKCKSSTGEKNATNAVRKIVERYFRMEPIHRSRDQELEQLKRELELLKSNLNKYFDAESNIKELISK